MPDRSFLGDLIVMHGPYESYALVPQPVMRFIESDQLNALRAELIQLRNFQTAVMDVVEQLPYATPSAAGHTSPVDRRREARAADPHAHACISCSPDGVLPGHGCLNCRQTGMDQTPCTALGHSRACPHGCCGGPRKSSTETNPSGGAS